MAESIPITDFKDLTKVWTDRIQHRRLAGSAIRPINALDTETSQGDIFLIADSDGRYSDNISLVTVIEFLFHSKYQDAWNFFFNLGYDSGAILKLFGTELFQYKVTRTLSFRYQDYKVEYIPKKCLRISKGHHSVSFFDIAQFYGGSLIDSYQKNIGPINSKYLGMKEKRAEFSNRFYRRHKRQVIDYCVQDCGYAKALAEKWIMLFSRAFSFLPQRWLSAGYLAEKVIINRGLAFPEFNQIPYEIQEFAYRAYFGGRFEMTSRGFIGQAFLYDINSAYPDKIARIPNLLEGRWLQSRKIHPEARMGFFRIISNVPECERLAPFPFRANHSLVFPSGHFETYVTLDELKVVKNDSWYSILDPWQFIPSDLDDLPYRQFVEHLYGTKQELKAKNDPLQLPFKLILNSLYGKTGELLKSKGRKHIGNLFNPVIFSHITGTTRAQIYNFVTKNKLERNLVGIATDSVCLRKRLEINSTKIGEFSFADSASDVYYLQNGFYRFNGKWKQRGLGKLDGKEIEQLEPFEKKGRLYYKFIVKRNNSLVASIIQNKVSDIGKIRPFTREVNINADRKRLWLGKLASLNDDQFNDSVPLSLNRFRKEEV